MFDSSQDVPAPKDHAQRRGGRIFWPVTSFWAAWLVGQVVRDRSWLTGLCLDIPSVVPAVLCLASAGLLAVKGESRRSLASMLLALPALGMVTFVENQWTRPSPARKNGDLIRLVHWNTGYGYGGLDGVERELVDQRARIYVLSEAPEEPDAYEEALAKRLGPSYTAIRLSTMAVIADRPLRKARRLVSDGELKVYAVTWQGEPRPLKIFAVDVVSNPLVFRDPVLRRLRSLMAEHRPDIVVGDFNSPRRSLALCPAPDGFVHAYDAAGNGWSATWPVPFPLLAIDQCLLSPEKIAPAHYALHSTQYSDHRMQIVDFGVVPSSRPVGIVDASQGRGETLLP